MSASAKTIPVTFTSPPCSGFTMSNNDSTLLPPDSHAIRGMASEQRSVIGLDQRPPSSIVGVEASDDRRMR